MVQSAAASTAGSPDLFERMASALLGAAHRSDTASLATKALSMAFQRHSASRPIDVERCSVVARNLLILTTIAVDEQSHQRQLQEVMELVKSQPTWPLLDRQFLAITAWNTGSTFW